MTIIEIAELIPLLYITIGIIIGYATFIITAIIIWAILDSWKKNVKNKRRY